MRECFFGSHSVPPTHENVLGVLSLIIYSLLLVISVKYIAIVMRADNQGEGGILALTALLPSRPGNGPRWPILVLMGIFGAALLYGDGMITPAITVLGAVEGLKVATPLFEAYVVPIAVAIIIGVFAIQRHGTHRVGGLFGPVMVVWFLVIAALGISWLDRSAGGAHRRRSSACGDVFSGARMAWLRCPRRRLPRGHGRRGALRRHGPFWQTADPDRMVRARAARAPPQLLRAGRVAVEQSEGSGTTVLPARAGLGALPARRPRDCGRDHRLAGAHLWRVLPHAAGDPVGILPASRHRAHLVARDRSGLRPAGELGAHGARSRS